MQVELKPVGYKIPLQDRSAVLLSKGLAPTVILDKGSRLCKTLLYSIPLTESLTAGPEWALSFLVMSLEESNLCHCFGSSMTYD